MIKDHVRVTLYICGRLTWSECAVPVVLLLPLRAVGSWIRPDSDPLLWGGDRLLSTLTWQGRVLVHVTASACGRWLARGCDVKHVWCSTCMLVSGLFTTCCGCVEVHSDHLCCPADKSQTLDWLRECGDECPWWQLVLKWERLRHKVSNREANHQSGQWQPYLLDSSVSLWRSGLGLGSSAYPLPHHKMNMVRAQDWERGHEYVHWILCDSVSCDGKWGIVIPSLHRAAADLSMQSGIWLSFLLPPHPTVCLPVCRACC